MPTRSNCLSPTSAPLFVCGLHAVALSLLAHAQPSPYTSDPRQTTTYRQIDQGLADQSPLSASARVVPLDLRQPVGFDQLFQLTGPGGRLETRGVPNRMDGGNGLFFRFSGGLVATFPRSVYAETPAGLQPLIPPGAVFSIGQKPAWGPGPHVASLPSRPSAIVGQPKAPIPGASRPARASSTAAPAPSPRLAAGADRAATRDPREPESLWTNEAYRRKLIERLLMLVAPG